MNRREELLRKARQDPAGFLEERSELEEQLQQQIGTPIQTLADQTQTIASHLEDRRAGSSWNGTGWPFRVSRWCSGLNTWQACCGCSSTACGNG